MYRFVILLAAVSAVMGQEQFFQKYSFTKAMTNCFGDEIYYSFLEETSRAEKECKSLPVFLKNMHTVHIPPYAAQQPGYYANIGGQSVYVPVPSYYPGLYSTVQYGLPKTNLHRQTRETPEEPFFDAPYLRDSIYKIKAALSNFTCVLRKNNFIDDYLNIRTDTAINNYNQLAINNELKKDLIDGHSFCEDLTRCLPLERTKSPIPMELQRLIAFVKCEKKTRMAACFKHDLRKNINLFDLSALPKDGGQSSDLEKLMAIIVGSDSLEELELL